MNLAEVLRIRHNYDTSEKGESQDLLTTTIEDDHENPL